MTTPGTEIVRHGTGLTDKLTYAKALADSGLLPSVYRKQPANVLYATEYGEMLGLAPLAAINGLHIIEGKPTASSGMVSALVRRAGHRLRSGYDAAKRFGWCEIVRQDDPDFTYRAEWSLERAQAAGLCQIRDGKPWSRDSKGNPKPWEKYPEAMMKARAITECARDACEEALNGVHYTPEELGADVDETGEPIKVSAIRADARPDTEAPDTPANPPAPVDVDWDAELNAAAGNLDALKVLWQKAGAVDPDNDALAHRIRAAVRDAKAAAEAEPVDAEVVEVVEEDQAHPVEPSADVTNTEPPANHGQKTAIAAALGEHNVKEREDRLAVISFLIGDRIATSDQLTKSEASHVIDAIAKQAESGDLAATIQAAIAAWSTHTEKVPA